MPLLPKVVRRRRADDRAHLLRDGDLPAVPHELPAARAGERPLRVPALPRGHRENDPQEARARLAAHVEADSPFALELLACMHQQGQMGFAKDHREAARLFRRAAKLGKPRANVRLGLLKLEGSKGVRQDPDGALAAFLSAARAGDVYGQYLAGRVLLDDESDAEGSTRQAIVLWEAAAE